MPLNHFKHHKAHHFMEVVALVGLLNLTEDSMKLQADWKVFSVLACLHTILALAAYGPTLMTLFMEVH